MVSTAEPSSAEHIAQKQDDPAATLGSQPVAPVQPVPPISPTGVAEGQTTAASAPQVDVLSKPPVHPSRQPSVPRVLPAAPAGQSYATPPVHPSRQAPTATMDPNVPSSESAPTALPTNPTTHPEEQKRAVQNEHPAVVSREVEKTKAEARELKGEKPKGTVVSGLEDDRLWAMLRRFDTVSPELMSQAAADNSKLHMCCIPQRTSPRSSQTCGPPPSPTCLRTLRRSGRTSSGCSRLSDHPR